MQFNAQHFPRKRYKVDNTELLRVNEAVSQSEISGQVLCRNYGIAQEFPQDPDSKHFFGHI